MRKPTRTLAFANLIGLMAVLVINFLSNSLPLNGKTPGELSDQYPNLFTPAGITFAIWGIIYSWLIVWCGAQVIAFFNKTLAVKVAPMLDKIGWLFAYSCFLNIVWLIAWHWEQVLVSVVVMANLLYILTQLNQAAQVGAPKTSNHEKWLEHLPFGIYQGWITVALIANVTAWLVSLGWSGGGLSEPIWAVIMASAGAALAIFMVMRYKNLGHGIAVAWALYGIYLKRIDAVESGSELVAWSSIGLMLAVLFTVIRSSRKWATCKTLLRSCSN
ncbi:MAG: hypothetical protein IPH31_21965 [Lewinellaceae bacterium]|nr:hypothetical protein [Lewinellaceae bacterium]